MKLKIGVILVILILFLMVIANVVGATKVYSREEIQTLEREGVGIQKVSPHTCPKEAVVGKPLVINGSVRVDMLIEGTISSWETKGRVSRDSVSFSVYKDGLEIFHDQKLTDDNGFYKFEFIPRETGYHKFTIRVSYGGEWHPSDINGEQHHPGDVIFYVSPIPDSDSDGWDDEQERGAQTDPFNVDTDGDGIWDSKDTNPLVASTPTPIPTMSIPTLKTIPAIAILLVVAYLFGRRK